MIAVDRVALDREQINRRGFVEFVRRAWHVVEPSVPLIWNWHLDEMCKHAEAITVPRRVTYADAIAAAHPELVGQWYPPIIRDLVVNIPPSHSKTVIWCILWPAWVWTWRPDYRWIFASYEDDVSFDAAKKHYELITSVWFVQRWGSILKKHNGKHATGDFYTMAGGRRFTTSVGGRATGVHCHCFVTDDPVKAEAGRSIGSELAAQLVKANSWHSDTVTTRTVDPKTFCKVVIMQRIHELDLSQQCIDQGYVHLFFAAKLELDYVCRTPIGGDHRTEEGELLFPERFPLEELDKIAKSMFGWLGPVASAQLQQRPAPKGGLIFRLDTFKPFKIVDVPIGRTVSCLSIDCNFKKADVNSDVGITISGIRAPSMYIYEALSLNIGFMETIEISLALMKRWRTTAVLVEDKALGPGLIEILRSKGFNNIIPVEPLDSKEARAHGANTYYQAGSVFHCDEMQCTGLKGEGKAAFERALNTFPRGKKKDVIDAHTQSIWWMSTQNYSKLLGALNALDDESRSGFDSMFRTR